MDGATDPGTLFVGFSDKPETLRLDRTNRHGLVADVIPPPRPSPPRGGS